jgi:signal transduction histidine kinase
MSFRSRLTITYAIATASSISILALALALVAGFLAVRPIAGALAHTTADVNTVVRENAQLTQRALFVKLRQLPAPQGVIIIANERRSPHVGAGHDIRHSGPPPLGAPQGIFDIPGQMGLRPTTVETRGGGDVFIAPDVAYVQRILAPLGGTLLVVVLLAIAGSLLLGRRLADSALRPIGAIQGELERFARGDFEPRAVRSSDNDELGSLVRAYNGAAAKVAAAFDERLRLEQQTRRFLGEAGHEMRTPLTVISGSLDVLEGARGDDPALRARVLPLLRAQTTRLRVLVERLMLLARLQGDEPGRPEPVDLVASVGAAVTAVSAARGSAIMLRAEGGPYYVLVDPNELHDAIGNLVDNATKYGGGNDVTVTVDGDRDSVVVRVADRGPGIAPGDQKRLFEHFFRGENVDGIDGSGLGLAIAARAAARASGELVLESSVPGRTVFRLTFPAYRDGAEAHEELVLG